MTAAESAPPAPVAAPALRIHLIHMGGNDCPPCVNWRRFELPKLEKTEVFKKIQFSYVVKVISSRVPSAMFLPEDARPYKDMLDTASGGNTGSPQAALLVNGQVYDYWFGARGAEQLEQMLLAILSAEKYHFERCVKRAARWACVDKGAG